MAKCTPHLYAYEPETPFSIHRIEYDVGPATTASTRLGRLSTMFRRVFMGICDHSSRSTLVMSDTDVG